MHMVAITIPKPSELEQEVCKSATHYMYREGCLEIL